ncbi:hypothetical protein RN001_016370 [Aquatica leii]|uniref:Vacuolar protein-sorting-associated protein 25 n=1 Tax=Aquatica leii TaxID=1421715 RepID=A0AAN7NZA7_9COLE|nr:hypothetical protein RN001_016370 [Aquatica leii]
MSDSFELPWQHSFPPFFTLQPHAETRARQISVWRTLILDYFRSTKACSLDIREASRHLLFSNTSINRKLNAEFILAILSDLQRTQNAAPIDKQRYRWEIYWHTLEEWGSIIYDYITSRGATNSVLTLFELTQGDDVQDEEFCGLETDVLIKALRTLEAQGKCELMLSDDQEGVKFF